MTKSWMKYVCITLMAGFLVTSSDAYAAGFGPRDQLADLQAANNRSAAAAGDTADRWRECREDSQNIYRANSELYITAINLGSTFQEEGKHQVGSTPCWFHSWRQ